MRERPRPSDAAPPGAGCADLQSPFRASMTIYEIVLEVLQLLEFGRAPTEEIHFLKTLERSPWIATAEDIVTQKLRWAHKKDLQDVDDILSVQGAALDSTYVERW